ncbi:MAG: hypothetical protein PVG41_20130 [Desulfobacteraceae bacterium]|jgi:hypothetical protein
MKPFNRLIACVLVLPTLLLFLPTTAMCTGKKPSDKAGKKTITRHEPKVMASPEKKMTPEQAAQVEKKKPNWLWIGIGAAVVVGLAAALAGGGGGGGSHSSSSQDEEGDITVQW